MGLVLGGVVFTKLVSSSGIGVAWLTELTFCPVLGSRINQEGMEHCLGYMVSSKWDPA